MDGISSSYHTYGRSRRKLLGKVLCSLRRIRKSNTERSHTTGDKEIRAYHYSCCPELPGWCVFNMVNWLGNTLNSHIKYLPWFTSCMHLPGICWFNIVGAIHSLFNLRGIWFAYIETFLQHLFGIRIIVPIGPCITTCLESIQVICLPPLKRPTELSFLSKFNQSNIWKCTVPTPGNIYCTHS